MSKWQVSDCIQQPRTWLWASMLRHMVSYLSIHPKVRAHVLSGLLSSLCHNSCLTDPTVSLFLIQGTLLQTKRKNTGGWDISSRRWRKVTQTHPNKGSVQGSSQGQLFTVGKTFKGCPPLSRTLGLDMADFGDELGSKWWAWNSYHCLLTSILEKAMFYMWKQICYPSFNK